MNTALELFAVSLCVAALVAAFSVEDLLLPLAAKRRAQRLFFANLDGEQRQNWNDTRSFEVVAASGRRYTISHYRPFNIHSEDTAYCIQVEEKIPVYDKLLAQRLLIAADERLFLSLANRRRR
jgi:hypothetical protein